MSTKLRFVGVSLSIAAQMRNLVAGVGKHPRSGFQLGNKVAEGYRFSFSVRVAQKILFPSKRRKRKTGTA